MERIQRLATRMVKGMRESPYEDRLHRLDIFSPERRRLRGDLILAYNIFHGRLDLPQAECFDAPGRIPSRARLQVAPPQLSLTQEQRKLLCETSYLVE